jgi:hypothetical protein
MLVNPTTPPISPPHPAVTTRRRRSLDHSTARARIQRPRHASIAATVINTIPMPSRRM